MKERYIPAFIVLIAAAITSIINIVNEVELVTGLKRLLLVILVFYVIGLIFRAIIKKVTTSKLKEEVEMNPEDEENQE